jgi:hypothetical protein
MQENSTFKSGKIMSLILSAIFTLGVLLINFSVSAQTYCANETIIWSENFGTGITGTSHPDVVNIIYASSGNLADNFYRIINNTQQRPEWHSADDHTPSDANGKMLVVNGSAETFYTHIITNGVSGFLPGSYAASLFLMNVNTPGTCAPSPLLPTITFKVEYNTATSGNSAGWVQLQTVTASSVPQSATPTWAQLGGVFSLPVLVQRIRLTMSDGTASGCGNDFAIDDIQFATCPEGGPLPVEFLNITAILKGGAVAINWSTASESNNKYFDVEKSFDGSNWTAINSLISAGNSSTVKNYSSYDAKPAAGYNYYRIKQVDTDGKFKYSSVAKVKISIEKTGVSVLANPFVNNITVDFLSNINQKLNVRLMDVSGKQMAIEKWQINKGSTRLSLNNVANLQRGMYIFTVVDDNGNVIYNNKLIKQ